MWTHKKFPNKCATDLQKRQGKTSAYESPHKCYMYKNEFSTLISF